MDQTASYWRGLRFPQANPERVSAIGLLGCPADYPGTSAPLPMRIGSISILSGFVVENLMQPAGAGDVRESRTFLGHPAETRRWLPDAFAEAWYRMDRVPTYTRSWNGILQQVLRLRGVNPQVAFTPQDLQSIQAPVTLLWGSKDPSGRVQSGRQGAEYFPDAEFLEVGVGHRPWLDEPERCGALPNDVLATRG